jgi:hypothetical protein
MARTDVAEPNALDDSASIEVDDRRRPRDLLIAGLLYLAGSVALFFHVVTTSLSRAATCTCSDVSQFAWFQQWPWVALQGGHSPVYSTAMFFPHGINLLSNTSATGIGLVMLPITAIFGPLASLNVALIAAPAVSALSMMYLAHRWCRSPLSAFVAGALYGFSPLILFHDALGHLNITFLAVVPLIVACCDDLFFTHRHRARRVGVALGVLLSWQFFIGSEVLVLCLVAGAFSLAALAALASRDRSALRDSIRRAGPGVVSALVITAVLLVVPISYALFGPGHYHGVVWPGRALSTVGIRSFLSARGGPYLWFSPTHSFLPATYLAPGLLVLLGLGALWRRHDVRLVLTLVLAFVMAWLSLGQHYFFAPWHYLGRLSVLNNVVNERFSAFLFLFIGLAVARLMDAVIAWRPHRYATLLAGVLAAVALAPYAINAVQAAPYPASRVWIPQWYSERASHLGPHQVVLGFPFFNTSANLLAVQAIYEMRYSVVGGTTPQWLIYRQGDETRGYRVIWDAASSAQRATLATSATAQEKSDVLHALVGWSVTYVVVPFHNGANTSPVARNPAQLATFLASILGPPQRDAGAWVWHLRRGRVLTS